MLRVCCSCGKILGYKKPLLSQEVTTGYCFNCIKNLDPGFYERKKSSRQVNCIHTDCFFRNKNCELIEEPMDCAIHRNFIFIETLREEMEKELGGINES